MNTDNDQTKSFRENVELFVDEAIEQFEDKIDSIVK